MMAQWGRSSNLRPHKHLLFLNRCSDDDQARGGATTMIFAGPLDRLDAPGPPREPGAGGEQQPLPDLSARPGAASGQSCARTTRAPRTRGLARALGLRASVAGDLRRSASLCRHLLPCRRLAVAWGKQRARAGPPRPVLSQHASPGVGQSADLGCLRLAVRRAGEPAVMSKPCRRPTRVAIKKLPSETKRHRHPVSAVARH
jgi:hypothetical protein